MREKQIAERYNALMPRLLDLYRQGYELLPDELLRLGEAVAEGMYGLKKDEAEGYKIIRQAAEKGDALAMTQMMWYMLENEKLSPEALKWMDAAAEAGDLEAIFMKGISLITGQGGVEIDTRRGWELLEEAANRAHPEALFQVAADYLRATAHEKDIVKAKYYELAALNAGSKRAADMINHFFSEDDLKKGEDYIDADRVIDNAVEAHLPLAELEKANTLFLSSLDEGATEPSEQVMLLLEHAAAGGVCNAMCNLAQQQLAKGDKAQAREWLERALAMRFPGAKGLLGELLLSSDVPQERERARSLLIEALDYGDPVALQSVKTMIDAGLIADLPGNLRSGLYDLIFWDQFDQTTNNN